MHLLFVVGPDEVIVIAGCGTLKFMKLNAGIIREKGFEGEIIFLDFFPFNRDKVNGSVLELPHNSRFLQMLFTDVTEVRACDTSFFCDSASNSSSQLGDF
jgi:hypothetical protein